MILLKSITKKIFLLSILSACIPVKDQKTITSIDKKPPYVQSYLEKTGKQTEGNLNLFIIYTDRCQSCSPNNLNFILINFKDKKNLFVLNASNDSVENKLNSFGDIFIDRDDNLTRYGLNNVENQYFKLVQGKVVYSSLINDNTMSDILGNQK